MLNLRDKNSIKLFYIENVTGNLFYRNNLDSTNHVLNVLDFSEKKIFIENTDIKGFNSVLPLNQSNGKEIPLIEIIELQITKIVDKDKDINYANLNVGKIIRCLNILTSTKSIALSKDHLFSTFRCFQK